MLLLGLQILKQNKIKYKNMIIWEKIDDADNTIGTTGYYLDHQYDICLVALNEEYYNNK
jgi:N6-adenosine-specific RNA methylase IME4